MGIVEQRTVSRLKGTVSRVFPHGYFHEAVSPLSLIFGFSPSLKEQSVKKTMCKYWRKDIG
jgi:hypothetical protein